MSSESMSKSAFHRPRRKSSWSRAFPPIHFLLNDFREAAEHRVSAEDLYTRLCRRLAQHFEVPLVMLVRKHSDGTVRIEASSQENVLWAAFQQFPERWDETVLGNGPAGIALRTRLPHFMRVNMAGFLPWRHSAEREDIRSVAAWPMSTPGGWIALVLFSRSEDALESSEYRSEMKILSDELTALISNNLSLPALTSSD